MFIHNKYYYWYQKIVHNSKSTVDQYFELHHIVPRSLGGSDNKDNLVKLTAREHFICHILLTKFTTGQELHRMIYAAKMMSTAKRGYQLRYFNSRLYESIKKQAALIQSEKMKGKQLSQEHREKISRGLRGRKNSEETIEKRRLSLRGQKRTPEQKQKMSQSQKNRPVKEYTSEQKKIISQKISEAHKGKPKSDEHKSKISKSLTGRSSGHRTEETKQKMRKPKSEAHRKAISEGRRAKYQAIRDSKI